MSRRVTRARVNTGALNTREFVDLMRILLAEYITDEVRLYDICMVSLLDI